MARFYSDEEAKMVKVRLLLTMVSEQPLEPSPCPLLQMQLQELRVLTKKLLEEVDAMEGAVANAIARERRNDD